VTTVCPRSILGPATRLIIHASLLPIGQQKLHDSNHRGGEPKEVLGCSFESVQKCVRVGTIERQCNDDRTENGEKAKTM